MKLLGVEVLHKWRVFQISFPSDKRVQWEGREIVAVEYDDKRIARYEFCGHCGERRTALEGGGESELSWEGWPLAVEKVWEKAQ